MPIIRINALPLTDQPDIPEILSRISSDLADGTGIDLKYFTVTWENFLPGQYAVAGKVADSQPTDTHPLLVDILLPDFNDKSMIGKILRTTAASIAAHTRFRRDNIFINIRTVQSGHVFDNGKIIEWEKK